MNRHLQSILIAVLACKERQGRIKGDLARSVSYGLHNLSSKRLKVIMSG